MSKPCTLSRMRTRAGLPAHKLQTRMEQGRELRGLYRELSHTRTSIAKFLRVTPRTLFNWETGRAPIPVAVLKLLRLLRRSELPGREWAGWCFNRGTLWSPEGHGFKASDFAWLSAMIRRARLFGVLYHEREQLRGALIRARAELIQAQAEALTAHIGRIEPTILEEAAAAAESGRVSVTPPGRATSGTAHGVRGASVTRPERLTSETAEALS